MKKMKFGLTGVLLGATLTLVSGAALADTLITVIRTSHGWVEVWVDSSGRQYTIECDSTGCIGGNPPKQTN
jgi:hypothetical protein